MATMTDDATAGYSMACDAAKRLKAVHPNHELLRLITTDNSEVSLRRDQERIERFWNTEQYGDAGSAASAKLDAITFGLLAKAMDRVLQALEMPTVSIERVRVDLDPGIDVFKVKFEQKKPAGVWYHTASDQTQLTAFLEGARAMASSMGGYISMPDIPQHVTSTFGGNPDIEDDIPF